MDGRVKPGHDDMGAHGLNLATHRRDQVACPPLADYGREARAMVASATPRSTVPPRRLGIIGSIVGVLALMAAVLPHWVVPIVFPPPPADKVIVDTGHRIKDRIVAKVKGVEYQAPKVEKSAGRSWSETASVAAISLGLLAVLFSVLSLIFREERLLAAVAAALGTGAIAIEISFVMMGVLILIVVLYVVGNIIGLF